MHEKLTGRSPAPDGLVARNQPSVGWVMYAFDPEGNAAQRFSSSGTVYAWTDYWLYGTASSTGPGISDTFGFEARYGYILDRELGWLHYCQNRYYENQSGRWLTRDPAGPAGGIDLYEYAGANPLRNVDPTGLDYICLGVGGNLGILIVGFWGSESLCVDSNGNVGVQSSNGSGFGIGGYSGGGTWQLGGGQGNLSNGTSHSDSLVGWGGVGPIAGGEIDCDTDTGEFGASGAAIKWGFGEGSGVYVGLAKPIHIGRFSIPIGSGTTTVTRVIGNTKELGGLLGSLPPLIF